MDMRMIGQVSCPGVEDPDHADLPTEVAGIERECLQSGRGGLKEQVVYDILL
jgi:hypothetical protein